MDKFTIQFHLTPTPQPAPAMVPATEQCPYLFPRCQVTSGLKSTWSLFPIIVKEIRTRDKEEETLIL